MQIESQDFDEMRDRDDIDLSVEEVRIYIHEELGFVNSFMLTETGQPHIIIPGYDARLGIQKPQMFHYIIRYLVVS